MLKWSVFLLLSFFTFYEVNAQNIDHWELLVNAADEWNYLVPSSEVPESWTSLEYDDSSWSSGQGGFGYGDDDDGTVISTTLSVYMRKKFSLDQIDRVLLAALAMDYDDGYIAYLNGTEIARSNMGQAGSAATFNQEATDLHEAQLYQGGRPDYTVLDQIELGAILQEGENILAVQVHNDNLNSSDLSANPYLGIAVGDAQQVYASVPNWFAPPQPIGDNFQSNLPIIFINTDGQGIPNEPKIDAQMGIVYNADGSLHRLADGFNNYNGRIGIEIRGSSSQFFDKKQYLLETRNQDGSNNNVSLLGMPEENDWILYAPFSDKSLIRNVVTYRLGRDLGRYAPRTHLCEVIINGEYMGVFVLVEKIKRDKNRVDISRLNPDEISGEDLTGGYIIKIDRAQGNRNWDSPIPPVPNGQQRTKFVFEYPDSDDLVSQQETYIRNYITDFETALAGPDFDHPERGYLPYVDLNSFVDFFLMNELTRNVDAYRLSTFMYKDKNEKLTMGPLWDFNLAFGNADYCEGGETIGWQYKRFNEICLGDQWINPFWWSRLVQDSSFCRVATERWSTLRTNELSYNRIEFVIDSLVEELDGPAQRNFDRWNVLGRYIWPNNFVGTTYESEIDYLKNWIQARLSWMDGNLVSLCSQTLGLRYEENELFVKPNPFTEEIRFGYSLSSIYRTELEVFDLQGRSVALLVKTIENRGNKEIVWDGSIDGGGKVGPGMYICRLKVGNKEPAIVKILKY